MSSTLPPLLRALSSFTLALMCVAIWRRHSQARPWRGIRYRTAELTELPTWHTVETANHVELDRRSGRWSIEVDGRRLESADKTQLEMYLDEMEGGAAC